MLEKDTSKKVIAIIDNRKKLSGSIGTNNILDGNIALTGTDKTRYHNSLLNRDMLDQHPISAITGLQDALNNKFDGIEVTEDGYLYMLCNGERISGPHGPFAHDELSIDSIVGLQDKLNSKFDGIEITEDGYFYMLVNNERVSGPHGPFTPDELPIDLVIGLQDELNSKFDGIEVTEDGYFYMLINNERVFGPYGPFAINELNVDSIEGLQDELDKKVDSIEVTEDGLLYLLSNGERISGPYGPFTPDELPIDSIIGLQDKLNSKFDGIEVTEDGYLYMLINNERVSGPYGPFTPDELPIDSIIGLQDELNSKFDGIEITEDGYLYMLINNERITGPLGPFILNELNIESVGGLQEELNKKVDSAEVTEDGLLYLLSNGERVSGPHGPFAGNGGVDKDHIIRLTNQNSSALITTAYGHAANLMFTFTSTIDEIPTGDGVCKISVNGINKITTTAAQGLNSIDVSSFLEIGTNNITVTVTDIYNQSRILSYVVEVIKLTIESTFDASVPYKGDITYKYIAYGAVEKTIHFVVDGKETEPVITSLSGKQATRIISAMPHGAHKLEVYSIAKVNETELRSPRLEYDIICLEENVNEPIIASVCSIKDISQGAQVSIPYIVYDPTKLTCDITLTVFTMEKGSEIIYSSQQVTVDRTQQLWNLRKYPIGEVYFRVQYGEIHKTHKITVAENDIDINAETNDLELYLSSEGRTNNEKEPGNWTYEDITTSFQNFNWKTTGWLLDENGDSCLRLNGTARAEIQFQPFKDDLRVYGETIELEFAIRDVNNRNTTVISCMSGGIGFEVKPDTAYIQSEGSKVFCNYKDEEKIRVAFVIESSNESRLLSIYLNGILSDAVQYTTTDNFQQLAPVNITIGSSSCGIDLYAIRVYSTALPSQTVVNNYIADMANIVEKTKIYEENDIYDDFGQISFAKAREKNSCMIIIGALPQSKGDKKNGKVVYYDVEDSNLNFEDTMQIDVQGTSSQWYVRKNWKMKFTNEHYIDFDQLPAKVICIKVDYAEATGTHNTQNANFVETLYEEGIPAHKTEPKARTTIYGKPILLFHQPKEGDTPIFYGKANFNYDKGAEHVFGFTNQYDVECWEFKDNTTEGCNFTGNINSSNWSDSFEARYPEEYTDITRLKEMHDWVVSTRGNVSKFKAEFENYFNLHYTLIYYVYTFFALMVDQRAKNLFLTYWADTGKWYPYFYDNDTCFGINNQGELTLDYYHEDIDQLGNATVYNGQNSTLWVNFREAYADEIQETYQQLRSDGKITYDMLEDRFITQGSDKWSESVYNEDSEFKYISMLRSDNDASNLVQLRGSGEEHFRYFVENRINYCDSKWYAPEYADDYVSLRIYTPVDASGVPLDNLAVPACADITITPYSNMYAGVRYKANGTLYQERSEHGVPVTFKAPDEIFNNTETAIYGASQLSSLGDLSPLYCGSVKAANATKLTELIIGSDVEGYSNENLWELAVGTNKLLKKLDVRNCPRLESPLALTGCPNIEEIYATGTSITGIDVVDGGILKIAHLPATVTNLTLKNQLFIEDFTLAGYDNIKTLHIENCPYFDTWALLNAATSLERLRLVGVDWTFDNAEALFDLATRGLGGVNEYGYNTDDPHISGKAHIKTLTGEKFAQIQEIFPYLDITYDALTSELIYMTWDGSRELYRMTIQNGGDGIDPVANYIIGAPARESTVQYDFTYAGWSKEMDADGADENALLNVESNRYVYVAYTKVLRYYDVRFYTGTTLLETISTPYGGTAYYTGTDPEKTGVDNPQDYEFKGWEPSPSNITGEMSCYAKFEFLGAWSRELVKRTISGDYENDRVTSVGDYAFYGATGLTSVDFPNATSVGKNAFQKCTKLTSIDFQNVTTIGNNAFGQLTNLNTINIDFSKVTEIGGSAFAGVQGITRLESSSDMIIRGNAFGGCKSLEYINLPNARIAGGDNNNVFINCTSLTTAILPSIENLINRNGLLSGCIALKTVDFSGLVGMGSGLFQNCTSLETVVLPSFNGSLYDGNFNGCTSLIKVDFGGGISMIRSNTFNGCTDLKAVIIRKSSGVSSCGNINNINNCGISAGTGYVYVPSALVDSYKTASGWSTYASQIRAIEDYSVDGTVTGTIYVVSNRLTRVTTNNAIDTVKSTYSATLTPDEGYSLDNMMVTVTMGGEDITDTAYDGNGNINIITVTGDVVITAKAVKQRLLAITPYDGSENGELPFYRINVTQGQVLEITSWLTKNSGVLYDGRSCGLGIKNTGLSLGRATTTITIANDGHIAFSGGHGTSIDTNGELAYIGDRLYGKYLYVDEV